MNDTLNEIRKAVDAELQARYGLTWEQACGDTEPLARALDGGLSAAAFVENWATRYSLAPAAVRIPDVRIVHTDVRQVRVDGDEHSAAELSGAQEAARQRGHLQARALHALRKIEAHGAEILVSVLVVRA